MPSTRAAGQQQLQHHFTGNQLQITPKALTVTADAASKVYGDADDLKYTSSGLITATAWAEAWAVLLVKTWAAMPSTRAAGQQQLQHQLHGQPAADHAQGLTVTADAASKVYGDADDLKYTSSGLIHGDRLGGSLGRAAGENVGSYAINQGSLANSNYSITFTGDQLQITPRH
jgi:uncharacterized protein (DUF1810 family)